MFGTKTTLALLIAGLYLFERGRATSACHNITELKVLNEKMCSGKWYIFAGSNRCDNCCFIRSFKYVRPLVYNVTDFIKRPGDVEPNIKSYVVTRRSGSTIYKKGNTTNHIYALDVNCNRYVAAFNEDENAVRIFTRKSKQDDSFLDSLDVLSKCDLKIYKHNPDVACEA